jgi:hypothetical protein
MTRLSAHEAGWSETVWHQVAEAAKIRKDVDLQGQAAASLGGLDARHIKHFTNFSASSLAFDTQGKRLLMGGMAERAMLWDSLTDQIKVSEQTGPGPVIFRADGTALQFAATTNSSIVLCDFGNQNQFESSHCLPWRDGRRPLMRPLGLRPRLMVPCWWLQ